MPRPQKVGLDYFSFDVYCDNKIKLIEAEFGLVGFAVIVKLWQRIYAERGYYCEFDEEVALLFADETKAGGNVVSEIIKAAIKRGIFDEELYEKYKILTSHGIQKRYLEGTRRRSYVNLESKYLLLDVDEIRVYVSNNSVYVDNNLVNVDRSTQSKVNKSKVNKSKVNESKETHAPDQKKAGYGTYKNVFLTKGEIQELKQKFPYDFQKKIDRLSIGIETKGYIYQNHYAVILQWAEQDAAKEANMPQQKRSKFCNYEDTNQTDYTALEERLMDRILEERVSDV